MGINYRGVMLYGVELTQEQMLRIVMTVRHINYDNAEIWEDDNGFNSLEAPDFEFVRVSYCYDGDLHYFVAIKDTYHRSDIYEGVKVAAHFEMDYTKWDNLLSDLLRKTIRGNWFVMPQGC